MERIRLDKLISGSGTATRSEAARLIRDGLVIVDGHVAASGAEKYDPEVSEILVGGTRLSYKKHRYIMMNKPGGVISATEDTREKTVLDLFSENDRRLGLFPAGRLDKDAEGLLILTNDGEYAHKIITPSRNIFKTYYVETRGALDAEDVAAFAAGLVLRDGLHCLPAVLDIWSSGERSAGAVRVQEGKYHQVKRMLASRGKPILYLKRLSIGGLSLDHGLKPGAYREMTGAEADSVFGAVAQLHASEFLRTEFS